MRVQVRGSILIDMDSASGRNPAIVSDCYMESRVVGVGVPPLTPVPGET